MSKADRVVVLYRREGCSFLTEGYGILVWETAAYLTVSFEKHPIPKSSIVRLDRLS